MPTFHSNTAHHPHIRVQMFPQSRVQMFLHSRSATGLLTHHTYTMIVTSTAHRAPCCTDSLQQQQQHRRILQTPVVDKKQARFIESSSSASSSKSRLVRCSAQHGRIQPVKSLLPTPRAVAAGRGQHGVDMEEQERRREEDVERAKMDLLQAVMETKRGAQVSPDQRAIIEEAMVGVETFNAGAPLELDALHGTWLLQYTTAPDVISLLQAAELPLLQVGQVYQSFDCKGRTDGGTVENIVRWSVPGLLQANEGATLIVTAKFSVASPRSIVLQFEEARVGELEISAELETLIAPALLPRTFINLQILQFLRSLDLRFPLRGGSQTQPQDATRAPIGAWYNLTYLDRNLLLGRALGTGGIFVFTRTQARRKPT